MTDVDPALELLYQIVFTENGPPTDFLNPSGSEICYTCGHEIMDRTDGDADVNHEPDCKWMEAIWYCCDNHPELIAIGRRIDAGEPLE